MLDPDSYKLRANRETRLMLWCDQEGRQNFYRNANTTLVPALLVNAGSRQGPDVRDVAVACLTVVVLLLVCLVCVLVMTYAAGAGTKAKTT